MEIYYCELCRSRVTEGEIDAGDAFINGPSVYCLDCVKADPDLDRAWRETSRSRIPAAKKELGKRARRMREPRTVGNGSANKPSATILGAMVGVGMVLVVALVGLRGRVMTKRPPRRGEQSDTREASRQLVDDADVWAGDEPPGPGVTVGDSPPEPPPSTKPADAGHAWILFLKELASAGKRGLPEATRLVAEKSEAFEGTTVDAKLERVRSRTRDAARAEPSMVVHMQELRGMQRMHVGGRPVSGRIVSIDGRSIRLKPAVGDERTVAFDAVAPADIVRLAGYDRSTDARRMRAARYCLVRGEPQSALRLIEDLAGPEVVLLRDDIDGLVRALAPSPVERPVVVDDPGPVASAPVAPHSVDIDFAEAGPAPVAWWRFDEGEKGRARDASGNGHDGSLMGMHHESVWVVGVSGTAIRFDGVDDRVEIDAPFTPPLQSTVAFWMRPDDVTNAPRVLGGHDAYEVRIMADGRLDHRLGAAGNDTLKSKAKVSPGSWYHIACSYDAATSVSAVYVNGKLDNAGSHTDAVPGELTLWVGARTNKTSESFRGSLDDVRIYDRVLSAEDVAVLAARGGLVPGTRTVDYYRGITGHYYRSIESLGADPRAMRQDSTLDLVWKPELLPSGIDLDRFAVRWTGELRAPAGGIYTLDFEHDDGARLWIADRLVMSKWKPAEDAGRYSVELEQGWHSIRLDYFQKHSEARVHLRWTGPGFPETSVDERYLRSRKRRKAE